MESLDTIPEARSAGDLSLPPEHGGEIARMILRLHDGFPEVSLATIAELVDRTYTDLGSAKVQSFRQILTERQVRRDLRGAGAKCDR